MNWLLNRVRSNRKQFHLRQVKLLQQRQQSRIQVIEERYQDLEFFALPDTSETDEETGVIPDAREKYLIYLLQRVGIYFIPAQAITLARKAGPAIAAEQVCRWLGLDYHKIAAVAPRVASETVRATKYFKEMKQACEATGINPDPLLPHIHFGSHDIRDILFENFRITVRILQLFDSLIEEVKQQVDWEAKRKVFTHQWKDIPTDRLILFYNQGILLSEYQKTLERGNSILNEIAKEDEDLFEDWLSDEATEKWYQPFPDFEVVIFQVHLSNRVREIDYRCSREWNRILKKLVETQFDFQIPTSEGLQT